MATGDYDWWLGLYGEMESQGGPYLCPVLLFLRLEMYELWDSRQQSVVTTVELRHS